MHVWQAFRRQRQRRAGLFALNAFSRFFGIAVERIFLSRCAFGTRNNAHAAVNPFLSAGAEHLHSINTQFHVHAAVDHKFTVFMQQIFVFRHDSGIEDDTLVSQFTIHDLPDGDAIQFDRLTGINAVALRCNQLELDGARILKQLAVTVEHHKMLLRFTFARDQFQRIAGQQLTEVGIAEADFRTVHFNACASSDHIQH